MNVGLKKTTNKSQKNVAKDHESIPKSVWIDAGKSIAGASVRDPNAKVYCAWEDLISPSFESMLALIMDLNGVLLQSIDHRYVQPSPIWKMLTVRDMGGTKLLEEKVDVETFLEWCLKHFNVYI